MATVVRVRRKRQVEKSDSLVISCKRQRIDDTNEAQTSTDTKEVTTTFKYAGTVEEKFEPVERHILGAVRKSKLEKEYKQHQVNIPAKSRLEQRMVAKSRRYKVISAKRDLEVEKEDSVVTPAVEAAAAASHTNHKFCVVDIEEDGEDLSVLSQVKSAAAAESETLMCNNTPMVRENVPKEGADCESYVYDLYYVNTPGFDQNLLDNIITVQAYDEEFIFDGYRDNEFQEYYEDEDDSNDEGNWRNDYPDEDPFIYENQDTEYRYGDDGTRGFDSDDDLNDMVKAKCKLGNEDEDWSSEEDASNSHNHFLVPTRSWEQYKKRVTRELEKGSDSDSDDKSDLEDKIS